MEYEILIKKEEKNILLFAFLFLLVFYILEQIPLYQLSMEVVLGLLVSYIFYFMNVYLPENRRRDIIKNNFKKQYSFFKENIIGLLVSASGNMVNANVTDDLKNIEKFREFFKAQEGGLERWDKVANKLELDDCLLKEILIEMEIIMNETEFILNNILIDDDEVFIFLKRLSTNVYRLRYIDRNFNGIKYLMGFLWDVFAGWSFADEYRKNDILDVIISKL